MTGKELVWSSAADKFKDLTNILIAGGKTKTGEIFNICRVLIGTSKVTGKLIDGKCHASLGGEKVVKEFEESDALIKQKRQ